MKLVSIIVLMTLCGSALPRQDREARQATPTRPVPTIYSGDPPSEAEVDTAIEDTSPQLSGYCIIPRKRYCQPPSPGRSGSTCNCGQELGRFR